MWGPMDLRDSPELAEFRSQLREWLSRNLSNEPEPKDMAARFAFARDWQKKLYAAGWYALSWPTETGGRGLGPIEEAIASEELGRAGAPATFPSSHLGRAILEFGSESQRRQYLPGLLSAEAIWCQGFSEPSAGSDLAAIRTTGVRKGNEFVLSGQKVWTSFGKFADYSIVLARTNPDATKHRGISAFIVEVATPGVLIRPIRLANGDEEFSEMFLDEVAIPEENLLGKLNEGWGIALATIAYERGAVDIGYKVKFERYFAELVAERNASSQAPDIWVDNAIGSVAVLLEVLRMHCLRRLSDRVISESPGPTSSIDKLFITRVEQELMEVATRCVAPPGSPTHQKWFDRYLYGRAGSIYGGSEQIQRSIIAERILHLRFS